MIPVVQFREYIPQYKGHYQSESPPEQYLEREVYAKIDARVARKERICKHHSGEPSPPHTQGSKQENSKTCRGMPRHRARQSAHVTVQGVKIGKQILRMRRAKVEDIVFEEVAYLIAYSHSDAYEQKGEKHVFPSEPAVEYIQDNKIERYPIGYPRSKPHDCIEERASVKI